MTQMIAYNWNLICRHNWRVHVISHKKTVAQSGSFILIRFHCGKWLREFFFRPVLDFRIFVSLNIVSGPFILCSLLSRRMCRSVYRALQTKLPAQLAIKWMSTSRSCFNWGSRKRQFFKWSHDRSLLLG